jgi:hypothetical protein
MASIAVTTAGKINVVESLEQHTLRAGEALLAGNTVTIDGTTGLFVKGDADGAGTLADIYGIATRSVAANEPVTAIRRGVLTGWTWSTTAYMTKVLAADTAGEITVTAGESNGASADVVIGRVISIDNAIIGGSPEKALLLTL